MNRKELIQERKNIDKLRKKVDKSYIKLIASEINLLKEINIYLVKKIDNGELVDYYKQTLFEGWGLDEKGFVDKIIAKLKASNQYVFYAYKDDRDIFNGIADRFYVEYLDEIDRQKNDNFTKI